MINPYSLHSKNGLIVKSLVLCFFMFLISTQAKAVTVASITQLQNEINRATAGAEIIVRDGSYTTTGDITINNRQGSETRPIVLRAQTIGGVTINGKGGFITTGSSKYVTIQGFVFKHESVGAFHSASFCKITKNVYDLKQRSGVGGSSTSYLKIIGDNYEVSYNTFENKDYRGPMVSIQGPGSTMGQNNWIHHNHFKNFPDKGTNDNAAIQPGYSAKREAKAFLLVEHNLFEDLVADAEGVISVKCWNVIFRYNTIRDCNQVSLRQGNESEVYGNYFFNSGVRFADDDHKIYNNHFYNEGNAIVLFSRLDATKPSGYSHEKPDNCFVGFNTFHDCGVAFKHNGSGGSKNLVYANNLHYNCGKAVELDGETWSTPKFEGNLTHNTTRGNLPSAGLINQNPQVSIDSDKILHLKAGSPAINASKGSYSFVSDDMDGQTRSGTKDIGADELGLGNQSVKVLTAQNVGPSEITIPVNTAPKGSFVQPMTRTVEVGYSLLSFEVDASDAEGDGVILNLSIDGTELRSEGSAPYEWGHTSGNPATATELLGLSIGDHEFKVVITDSKGASSTIKTTIAVTEMGRSIYSPIHDAYVEDANSKNDGVLRLEEGRRKTYLQFELPDVPAGFEITEASLKLTVDTDFGGGTIVVYNSTDNNWIESGISQNNAPSAGQELSQLSGPFATGNTYSLDVLGFEMRNGKVTFVLESNGTGADDVSFASKENTTYAKPVLSVKVDRVTSIDESMNISLTVFPNPSENGMFHLSVETNWEVVDSKEQSIKSGNTRDINLLEQASGLYFLRTEGKMLKLVKE